MIKLKTVASLLAATLYVSACGGGGSTPNEGDNGGGDNTPPDMVTISGKITYDFVPHNGNGSLNYNNISSQPVRGATIQLLNTSDAVVDTTQTDNNGDYSFESPANTMLRVRVLAELLETASNGPSWNIRVTDNTRGNALYSLNGQSLNSGTSNTIRDLHAPSGWTGTSYGELRAAGPFAIIDSVYQTLLLLQSSDPDISLPPVELRWSTNNIAVSGNVSTGNIGTSFFNGSNIFLLGHEDNDTDEYDRSVVQHEFGHYLEATIARSDSIGGAHSQSSRLDLRVAFSEGFANAFTAIASGTGFYEDSVRERQSAGFRFSLEDENNSNLGWYSESSAGHIVYDLYDDTDDGGDEISLGFTPLYEAFTSDEYRNNLALTSIYSFVEAVRNTIDDESDEIEQLFEANAISGEGAFGVNETNDGGVSFSLPVYHELNVGERQIVCGSDQPQLANGLGVRRFLRLRVDNSGAFDIRAAKSTGAGDRDPDIRIHQRGQLIANLDSSAVDIESVSNVNLAAGEYILEVFDFNNVAPNRQGGFSCFEVSVL